MEKLCVVLESNPFICWRLLDKVERDLHVQAEDFKQKY